MLLVCCWCSVDVLPDVLSVVCWCAVGLLLLFGSWCDVGVLVCVDMVDESAGRGGRGERDYIDGSGNVDGSGAIVVIGEICTIGDIGDIGDICDISWHR
jgi:hypothetical protein